MENTEQEIKEALNKLVEEGKLHLIILPNGEASYINNTFKAGYDYAKTEKGR